MSLQTWQAEFYQEPAGAFTPRNKSESEALAHSVTKWTGLLEENLRKHDVYQSEGMRQLLYERGNLDISFPVDGSTCALCQYHQQSNSVPDCGECILYQTRGGYACYEPGVGGSVSPYRAWTSKGNPKPMLQLMKQAKDRLIQIAPASGGVH